MNPKHFFDVRGNISEPNVRIYEVWSIAGYGEPVFVSSEPIEIVYWIFENRHAGVWIVHPQGEHFQDGSMLQHDFVARHKEAVIDDIIKRAIDQNHSEGVARAILDIVSFR